MQVLVLMKLGILELFGAFGLGMWEPVAAGLGYYSRSCYYCRGAPLAEPCCAEVHARMKSLRSVQAEYLGFQVLVLVKFGILELFGALGLGIWLPVALGLGHYSGYCYYCRGGLLAEPCCAEVHARMKSLRSSVQAELQALVLVKRVGASGLGMELSTSETQRQPPEQKKSQSHHSKRKGTSTRKKTPPGIQPRSLRFRRQRLIHYTKEICRILAPPLL